MNGLEVLGENIHFDISGYFVISKFDIEVVDCSNSLVTNCPVTNCKCHELSCHKFQQTYQLYHVIARVIFNRKAQNHY